MLSPRSPRGADAAIARFARTPAAADLVDLALDLAGVVPDALAPVLGAREHAVAGRALDLALRRASAADATTCLAALPALPRAVAYLDLAVRPTAWTLRLRDDIAHAHPYVVRFTPCVADDVRAMLDAGAAVYFPRSRRYVVRRTAA